MPLYIVRPGHLHTADRALSSLSESGRTVAPPESTSTNVGSLRLRASAPWTPTADLAATVKLQTGGGPTGYAIPGTSIRAPGSAALWKPQSAASTLWRGYIDTPYLVRVAHPVAWGANLGPPGSVRELPDGYLGVMVSGSTTSHTFRRIATDWTSSSAVISTDTITATFRNDWVILPSGRLVAFIAGQFAVNGIKSYYSDDYGVTWAALGQTAIANVNVANECLCAEVLGETIVITQSRYSGATTTGVLYSTDGGATFVVAENADSLRNTRSCAHDGLMLVASRGSTATINCFRIASGGGMDDGANTQLLAGSTPGVVAIARRDDGTIWCFTWEPTAGDLGMLCSVSLDGGLTFSTPTSTRVCDLESTGYATSGFDHISAGVWRGSVIVVALVDSNAASDNGLHFMEFGGWSNFTEGLAGATSPNPFQHSYFALDYPQNVGWTRTDLGAGATITNQPYLEITVGAGDNSEWRSSAGMWTTAAGDGRTVRARIQVVSGGLATSDRATILMAMDDGVNNQIVNLRFSATEARAYDAAGVQIGSTLTLDLTKWTDLRVSFRHDYPAAGAGLVAIEYQQDADLVATRWLDNANVPEAVGLLDRITFGGTAGGATVWRIGYIGISETEANADAFSNPADLTGRPLSAADDYYLSAGVYVGGFNTGGVPGDEYSIETEYNYGKADVWREFRPSRQTRSAADNTAWDWRADAGANDRFKGNLVALFGTNFRSATFQMNALDSWGAPSVTQALDATVESFTVGAGVRGAGYVGPTATPSWRIGQYRSDEDGHRWFVEINSVVYEIADNDASRLYIEGVDLSAASGTAYIFGDRMATTVTFAQYRFMRVSVASQDTADGHFRLGTLIFDQSFTPAQLYDYGFVDRVEPNVEVIEADNGSRSSSRRGPRRRTLAIQWPPLDSLGPAADLELKLRDLYSSLEGAHRPFVFWRDSADQRSLLLCRLLETYSGSNVWGEDGTSKAEVTRVDQLVISEEL